MEVTILDPNIDHIGVITHSRLIEPIRITLTDSDRAKIAAEDPHSNEMTHHYFFPEASSGFGPEEAKNFQSACEPAAAETQALPGNEQQPSLDNDEFSFFPDDDSGGYRQ